MRMILILCIFLSGCATVGTPHVKIEYGKLTVSLFKDNPKNHPKTIQEVFEKEKEPIIDKRILGTLEWATNPFK